MMSPLEGVLAMSITPPATDRPTNSFRHYPFPASVCVTRGPVCTLWAVLHRAVMLKIFTNSLSNVAMFAAAFAITCSTVQAQETVAGDDPVAATTEEAAPEVKPSIDGSSETPVTTTNADGELPAPQPEESVSSEPEMAANPADRRLSFAFEGTPWRDVVKWLAESADLALHIGDIPTGSFTYNDAGEFTPQQAIERVNLFLMPEGFALIRSGQLLSLINLTDRRSALQLDAIAKLVPFEEIEQLEAHDVVKCMFPLGELKAEDAVEELTALNLMVQPAVFPKTNQLLITDTVSKLRAAKTVLNAFEPKTLDNGTVVKGFRLEHVDAEDVLTVARPHLGLATGEMIGIDVSISADVLGKNIFVTGVEDKVVLIEGLIESIDVAKNGPNAPSGDAVLKTYVVDGGNLQTVYDVLQTLLVGEDVRLSADTEADTIVALANPEVQSEIEETITKLKASGAVFEVISLNNVDPYFAISLIEQMLDLPDELLDDPDTIDPNAPKIDADAGNRRLYVRAKQSEIDEIKKIVAGLEDGGVTGESDTTAEKDGIRIFPLKGEIAERTLRTAATFWRKANPVIFYPLPTADPVGMTERVLADPSDDLANVGSTPPESPNAQFLTDNLASQSPPIRCQLTTRGLLLQCDDIDALDDFEEHLRSIAGPSGTSASPPIVYYLKYTRPEEALKMLAELFDGGEAAKEGEAGSLVNSYISGDSYYYSVIRSRDGTLSMINGSITIVADTRLNRLIVQGTTEEVQKIEAYLKIIDKDQSLTSIETYGTSHIIELVHSDANEVATAIREAYASRVDSKGGQQQGGQVSGQQGQPGGQNDGGNEDGENGKKNKKANANRAQQGGGGAVQNLEPQMTIAVHQPSNSLIVTAPEALFKEVETLAKLIDDRSRQTVNVIRIPDGVQIDAIQRVLGGASSTRSRRREPSRPEKSGS